MIGTFAGAHGIIRVLFLATWYLLAPGVMVGAVWWLGALGLLAVVPLALVCLFFTLVLQLMGALLVLAERMQVDETKLIDRKSLSEA